MKKIIIIVLVVLITIGAAALVFSNKNKAKAVNNSYITSNIEMVTVSREDLEKTLTVKGTVNSFESEFVKYVAPIKVDEVCVKDGDKIAADQKLIKVNDENLDEYIDTFIQQLNSQLKQYDRIDKKRYKYIKVYAKADGRVSKNNLDKGEKVDDLLKNGDLLYVKTPSDGEYSYGKEYSGAIISSITKKAVINAKVEKGDLIFTVKIKDEAIEKKNEEIERSQEKLDNLLALKESPYITIEEEGFVKQVFVVKDTGYGTDEKLIEYYAKDSLCAMISVSKQDVKDLEIGMPASVEVDGNIIEGEIRHINYISNETGDFDVSVRLLLDKEDEESQVFPGLDSKVTFEFEKSDNAIAIPNNTIKSDTDGTYVIVYTGDMAEFNTYTIDTLPSEKRYIEKGLSTPTKTEVTSGLQESEIIVLVKEGIEDDMGMMF